MSNLPGRRAIVRDLRWVIDELDAIALGPIAEEDESLSHHLETATVELRRAVDRLSAPPLRLVTISA